MNQGRLQDALQLFEQTIAKDPTLSRAHNNRAALLIRLGVDVSDLLLPLATALATSETTDDFGRHLINLCMVAAYGTDQGGQDVLTVVDTAARTVIEEQCPEHQRGLILEYLSNLIAGFRDVAGFRAALAQRRWKEASGALCSARATFQRASLAGLVGGVDDAVRYLDLARRIFAFVEDIAAGRVDDPAEARDKAMQLHENAAKLRTENPDSLLCRLLDVLGWFLSLLLHQLDFLARAQDSYRRVDDDVQMLIWLSTAAYRRLGDDLIGMISVGDRLCQTGALDDSNTHRESAR
jgi:hypothetical protein